MSEIKKVKLPNDSTIYDIDATTVNGHNVDIDVPNILQDLPTGSISTVNDAAPLPLNALKVSVEAWQEGSGDPSPSNVRPIRGRSSASIYNKGKNLFPMMIDEIKSVNTQGTWSGNDYYYGGMIFTLILDAKNSILGIKINGRAEGMYKDFCFTGTTRVNLATYGLVYGNQYTISGSKSGLTVMLNGGNANIEASESGTTFIATNSDVYYPALRPTIYASFDNVIIYPQIEAGTQATDFVPYCTTYTHAFTDSRGNPLECLGGEWNVTDGDLDHNGYVFNLNDYNFKYNATTKTFYRSTTSPLPEAKRVNGDAIANAICDCFKCVSNDELKSDLTLDACFSIHYEAANSWINIRDLRFTAPADFRSAMTGQKIIYELATPQAIPQQPLTPRMLEGTNNLYADCGKVIEGEYFVDSDLTDSIVSVAEKINTDTNDKVTQTEVPNATSGTDYYSLTFAKDYTTDTKTDGLYKTGNIMVYKDYLTNDMSLLLSDSTNPSVWNNLSQISPEQIRIGKNNNNTVKIITVTPDDIALTNNTWDGTNTSLKTTLANIDAKRVEMTAVTNNAEYEVLLLGSTSGNYGTVCFAGSSSPLKYNPNRQSLSLGRKSNTTIGQHSCAFGVNVTASGTTSFAEGYGTIASGDFSHVEGDSTIANGTASHAEGDMTTANGRASHAEGDMTIADGYASHAEGIYTIASHESQHVFGEYNILDASTAATNERGNYVEIVGNGTATDARSNARTLDWSGNEWIAGTLTQGSSKKIKKNISPITDDEISKVLELNGVKFDYIKTGTDNQAERGFIAEEVAEVLPNLVTEEWTDDDGNLLKPASLNYLAIIPYLVEICKKQQEEINELKQKIKE